MRTVSVVWGAYISNRIGAEGMGLFSLITSAYSFAVTLAISGISLAVTRLVSEELAYGNGRGAVKAMKRCLLYSAVCGGTAAILLFFGADTIAVKLLGDTRTAMSLKALAISLPFIAISNIFAGYFSAVRRVYKSALSNVFEQFIKIAIIIVTLNIMAPRGIEYACLALVIGTSVSEGISFSYMFVLYIVDKKRHLPKKDEIKTPSLTKRMLGISIPIALSAYLRSGLSTVEHILIPKGLRKNGADAAEALSMYGIIHGMVFPLILFPAAICSTFASLIVPELSELSATYHNIKESKHIKYIVSRAIKFGLLFAVLVSGILITFSDELGNLVYGNDTCGTYIKIFGFLVPIMYLDTVVDGMLKGLGEQMASMRYNIIDAAVSVALVIVLLPLYGIKGYVYCVFITELLNASLSLARLIKVTGIRFKIFEYAVIPGFCSLGAVSISNILTCKLSLSLPSRLALGIFTSIAIYFLFTRIFGALTNDDVKWAKSIPGS